MQPSTSQFRMLRMALLMAAMLAVIGCVSPLSTNYLAGSRRQDSDSAKPDGVQTASAETPLRESAGQAAAVTDSNDSSVTHEEALAGVLEQLREIEAIDPAAKERLLVDLEDANPENYPLIVDAFRTALAYRKQLAAREKSDASADQVAVTGHKTAGELPDPSEGSATSLADAIPSRHAEQSEQLRVPLPIPAAASLASANVRTDAEILRATPRSTALDTSNTLHDRSRAPNSIEAYALPHPHDANRASRTTPSDASDLDQTTANWRIQLEDAITAFESTLAEEPRTVDELHDHIRLRMLKLIAGKDQEAYQPIPGASTNQHEFLSQQMFALGTFLDLREISDERQRAAAALIYLDEARNHLAELATLRVKTIRFVTRVDGYGAYENISETEFDPGEPVTLYAEIEGFRSQSTRDGTRTLLGTSYQIVDAGGQRVAGAQFPDVEDVCRSPRRDFYVQYSIDLPTRIYTGDYELQLIVTDQLSNKIGHASVPFKIVE